MTLIDYHTGHRRKENQHGKWVVYRSMPKTPESVERTVGSAGWRWEGMRESQIERGLVKVAEAVGGMALKFVSPGCAGVPDRIVLLPGGKLAFVELKVHGRQLRPLQKKRKGQLEALGFLVYCLDGIEQIGGMLDEIRAS